MSRCTNSVYLSGACECESFEGRSGWRNACQEWLNRNCDYLTAINPLAFYDYGGSNYQSEREVFRFELRKVKEAVAVLVNMKNIRKSVGTIVELYAAFDRGIPIIAFDEDAEDESTYHPWIVDMCDRIERGEGAMEAALIYICDYYDHGYVKGNNH